VRFAVFSQLLGESDLRSGKSGMPVDGRRTASHWGDEGSLVLKVPLDIRHKELGSRYRGVDRQGQTVTFGSTSARTRIRVREPVWGGA